MCLISGLVMETRKRNQARFLSLGRWKSHWDSSEKQHFPGAEGGSGIHRALGGELVIQTDVHE